MAHNNEIYLIFIDILGFGPIAKIIEEKMGIESRKVRATFLDTIKERVEEVEEEGLLIGRSYGRDDWLLAVKSIENVFLSISKILDHNTGYKKYEKYKTVPLEIAIGVKEYDKWARLDGNEIICEDETYDYLKHDILKKYREWYKEEFDKDYVEQTYIVITDSFRKELSSFNQDKCMPISDEEFHCFPNCILEKEVKIINFLKKIGHEKSDFSGSSIDDVFIPPDGYEEIKKSLEDNRLVILTGTPGYGKTYTAIRLLWEYYNNGYIPNWIPGDEDTDRKIVRDNLANIETHLEPNTITYFEDPFGKTEYEGRDDLKEKIDYIISSVESSDDAFILITSRKDVLERFENESYSPEEIKEFEHEMSIIKPVYGQQKREKILKEWAFKKGCKWLENEKLKDLVFRWIKRRDKLPTPLSIYLFVKATINTEDIKEFKEKIIKYSGRLEKALADEIVGLYESNREDRVLFLSLVFISEDFEVDFIKAEYEKMKKNHFEDFENIIDEEYRVKERSFEAENYLELSHPLFFKSIIHFLKNPGCRSIFLDVSNKLLTHEDRYVQWKTAESLGKIRDPQTFELLIKALGDSYCNVRRYSAWALGEIGDKKAVKHLILALDDPDFTVQRASIQALGEIGDNEAVDPLIKNLKVLDFGARKASAEALGKIGDKRAVKHLIYVLEKDKEGFVRKKAAEALGKIGDEEAIIPLIKSLIYPYLRKESILALRKIGKPAIKSLIRTLSYSKSTDGLEETLEKMGHYIIDEIIDFLNDKDDVIRSVAARSLKIIGDPKAVNPLIHLLTDESTYVRRNAILALGNIKDPAAVEPLIKLLKNQDNFIKLGVIDALGMIGDEQAVPHLINALTEGDIVQLRVMDALGKIGDTKAVNPIMKIMLEDSHWNDLSYRALDAIKKIKYSGQVQVLIDALEGDDIDIQLKAMDASAELMDLNTVDPIIELLKNKNPDVKLKAINTLGIIGDLKAVDFLIPLLKDDDWYVRRDVAKTLGKLEDSKSVDYLIDALKDIEIDVQNEAVWALAKIGDSEAKEHIMKLLRNRNPQIRYSMIMNLRKIGDPTFVDPIFMEISSEISEKSLNLQDIYSSYDPAW